MEAKLKSEKIKVCKQLVDTVVSCEETMEMVVPDYLPDILDIADTDGIVLMRSKEVENGGIVISGLVLTSVLYGTEEKSVKKMELNIPFRAQHAAGDLPLDADLVARLGIASIDTRVLNPRKILVRVNVTGRVQAFEKCEYEVCYGSYDEDEEKIALKEETCEVTAVTAIREKVFSVSEVFSIPDSGNIRSVLKSRVQFECEEMRGVGNRLIVKGAANIETVYETGDTGRAQRAEFNAPFSQILEFEGTVHDGMFELSVMPTSFYTEAGEDGRSLSIELGAVMQSTLKEQMQITYISDQYSTAWETTDRRMELEIESHCTKTVSKTVQKVIQLPVPATSITDASVVAGRCEVMPDKTIKTMITAQLLYIGTEGNTELLRAAERFSFEFDCDDNVAAAYIEHSSVSVQHTMDGVELSITLRFLLNSIDLCKISAISGISYDEKCARDLSERPSVVVHRFAENDSLWELAKHCASSIKAITEANELEEGTSPAVGTLLLIPKNA